jgi:PST family polysaccharide transporter
MKSPSVPNFLKEKRNRHVLENIVSLSILQMANYILPLLTLPYLVRVLGVEKYGLIIFSQAFVQFFIFFTDYGFDLTATREISIHRHDGDKVSRIYSAVMIVKLLILVVSLLMVILLVLLFSKFREHSTLYFFTFGWVVGHVLFPQWFFQGMEKMKYMALLNIFSKLVFTILIFVFIKSANDYLYQPLLLSLAFISSGLIAQYKVRKDFGVHFVMPGITAVKSQFYEGWHVFLSTMSISVYTISNTIILGLLTSNVYVGYFAVADKLIYAAKMLITPIKQALFPMMSKKFNESKDVGLKIAKKLLKIICVITFSESMALLLFSGLIIKAVMGGEYPESILVLRIMSFLPFILGINSVLGLQVMLPLEYKKQFSYIFITAGALNTLLAFILVPLFKDIGIAVAVVVTETFVASAMYIFLKSKNIDLFKKLS